MNISTGEKSLMIVISSIVLLCIAVVYIKHYFLEQSYENCRYYARGVVETEASCQRENCQPAATESPPEHLDIPADFARNYLADYRRTPATAQRFYRAYLLCMERAENGFL
ncbi:hypothetical protein FKG94_24270 [Exilibacterium tricleocarpae]|uniref:Uncharacterized protein n=1 Tax=Exilibacterium tricleocarpae TaxID=2591008 RepID=A0A545SSY3_9GAMM|nr:hypothetical protein [Exilibacterium tricleocarpae]TQV68045.1 hypothetical protein FKG94_24270 [Exilibacterium tricleocarpae]